VDPVAVKAYRSHEAGYYHKKTGKVVGGGRKFHKQVLAPMQATQKEVAKRKSTLTNRDLPPKKRKHTTPVEGSYRALAEAERLKKLKAKNEKINKKLLSTKKLSVGTHDPRPE
jgi:hypothetical protein